MLATTLSTPKDALEEALLGLGCKSSVLHATAKLVHLSELHLGSTVNAAIP